MNPVQHRLAHELRLLLLALQFFTRVPVTGRLAAWMGWDPAWLNQSARYFPLVGAFVGAVAALVLAAAALLWPMPVAVGLSMAATILLTGAFHEDGFADTCDGLGGSAERVRALEIMKDSRIGAYGAIGIVVMLGLKALTLASLPLGWVLASLCVAHTLSRAVAVSLNCWLPYAGDPAHAKAKPLALAVAPRNLGIALGWCGLLALTLAACGVPPPRLLLALAAALLVAWAMRQWLKRRLGGYTGDGLGATEQLTEIAVLLAFTASL